MENEIKNNFVFLADHLTNLERILLNLQQNGIISTNESDEILLNGTPFKKNMKLLDMIKRKDYSANRNKIIEIFRMTNNEHCADKIEGSSKQISEQLWFGNTSPNRFFTGREKEMVLLQEYWKDCSENETFPIVAVTGLGGVGKTELVRNCAKWFYKNIKGHCIWLEAENTLVESFHNLAEKLKISLKDHLGKDRTFQEIVAEVYEKLFGEKVLFVFDNLENYESPAFQLLINLSYEKPPTVMRPFVITTSRVVAAKEYFGTQCNHIDLQVLSKNSANQFLHKSLKITEPPKDITELIDKLCERLQFYPLALQQAASYISERSVYFGNAHEAIIWYSTEIETQAKAFLDYKLPKYDALENISNTTFLTWRITVDKLRESKDGGELAVDIMNIISFLSPDNIPTQMVTNILQKMGKVSDIGDKNNVFDVIRKYSMINYSAANIISVHRLVQEVTRIELKERGEICTLLNEIAKVMIKILKANKISLKELVHVQTVCQHLTKERELIEEQGEIFLQICKTLHKSGKYRDLLDFSIESAELVESALGQNSRWTLQMKHMKGRALRYLGEYSKALKVLKETYEKQQESMGEEHRDCMNTAKDIGVVYYLLEKYENAMQIYNDALDKAERIFGKEHRQTLSLKNNIGVALSVQNKLKEALEIYAEVLKVQKLLYGVEHPDTLTTKHNIAFIKLKQRNWPEALKEYKEVLEIREKVLESNHPHTLTTKHFIAETYYQLGKQEKSLQMFREVHEKRVQILGPRHPRTIMTEECIKDLETEITFERL